MKKGSARMRRFVIGNEDPKAFQVLNVVLLRSLRPLIDVTHRHKRDRALDDDKRR